MNGTRFAERLLAWHDREGRHGLPWQGGDAYRVWLSEIMLQQTQVATVVPYYERFIARFPDVHALAAADIDTVFAHWSGLGYYARARNLHRTARIVCDAHRGVFPDDIDTLESLPGIGRSTAGAILALAFGQRHPILDGNAKRVLARHAGIAGWPGKREVERSLWTLATARTPHTRAGAYTQAIMDLGATVCTRSRPRCGECPLSDDCVALQAGQVGAIPAPRPRKVNPVRRTVMLLMRDDTGAVLLEKRPPRGVWGGLWCLPQATHEDDVSELAQARYGITAGPFERLDPLRHAFTHFTLDIAPLAASVLACEDRCVPPDITWAPPGSLETLGLPAPVRRLLDRYRLGVHGV